MAEHGDLYEQQLFEVFESCLTKGEDELDESDLISICNKLHLDGLIEELKSCISKHRPDKQTISFQEFRDGLLLLLKKFQGLMDKQHIVQSCYTSNTCGLDMEKSEVLSVNSISKIHLQGIQSGIAMDEGRLMRLWEKAKVYLKGNTDAATMQLISNCLGIPELPKQITESIFEWLDQNCDGLISFDEFVIIFQNKSGMKTLQRNNSPRNSIVHCDVNTLDFNAYKSRGIDSIRADLDKREAAGISNITVLSSSGDLNALNTSLAEVTNIICDELRNLNESLDSNAIQSHIGLLREIVNAHQEEQRNLNVAIENMKIEKEKMRVDILEANERANLLAQEIEEYQVQLEKTKENLQKQSDQRCAEITKDLLDQRNVEREMDAAALKSRDDQLQALQKENHDMKNKAINMLQENQMLEAENKTLLNQIDKLRQSNNDLLNQIKMLDAEQDEIQTMEAKQQEQVDFFIDRIKQLQSEVTLLRDQNDELNAELENSRSHGKDTSYEAPSSLAYDLQLDESQDKSQITREYEVDRQEQDQARASFSFGSSLTEEQTDVSNIDATEYKRFRDMIIKDLENILTSAKCVPERCNLRDGISRLMTGMQSNTAPRYSTRDAEKSIASELEMECEERANESLRDFVVSKVPKLSSTKRAAILSSTEDLDDLTGSQDVKNVIQSKTTSLRDYPPRKEDQHSAEQCKINKEKNSSSSITEIENIPKTTAELVDAEKKQLLERCQELERSLDLLKTEYEECEDYWAAKLEEERQLFEQEQKLSDDKLAELINKIAEYEELISPSDKSKSNGRLSPIEEKFNLEQQYVDLEEEFEKWRMKTENDISQKNLEIGDLREKLKLVEQPITNDSYVQVPDEMSLPMLSDSSYCKSSSTSSIPSMNDLFANVDLCTNNQMYHTSADPLPSDHNRPLKQEIHIDDHSLYKTRVECPVKGTRGISKDQKTQMYQNNSHIGAKTMLAVKEEDTCDGEFKLLHVMKDTSYPCAQNNAQQRVSCVHVSVLQELKVKLYEQERKKRHLQRYIKQKRHHIEKLLQRVMMQHQAEVFELQCLLRNTQEKLQIQIQTTVDQADKLASADILVKDLYIENACLTAHMKRLQERCLVLSGLDVGSSSM